MAITIQINLDERGNVKEITRLNRELKNTGKAGKEAETGVATMNRSLSTLKNMLIGGGVIYGLERLGRIGVRLGKDFADTAGNFERLQISLDTITKGRGMEWFDKLNTWAINMPVNTIEAVKGFQRLRAMGLQPTIADMEILVDTSSALGGEADTFNGIVLALGQIYTKGKLMSQEIRQLAERGIPAYEILNEKLGITGEMLESGNREAIDAGAAIKALMEGMEERFGGQSQRMMTTYTGLVEIMKAEWGEFQRLMMDTGAFDVVKSGISGIGATLNMVNEQLRVTKERLDAIESLREQGAPLLGTRMTPTGGLVGARMPEYSAQQIHEEMIRLRAEQRAREGRTESTRPISPTLPQGMTPEDYLGWEEKAASAELEKRFHFKRLLDEYAKEDMERSQERLEDAGVEYERLAEESKDYMRDYYKERWMAEQKTRQEILDGMREYEQGIIRLGDRWGSMFDHAAQQGGNFVKNLRAQLAQLATSLAFRAGTAGLVSMAMGSGFGFGAGAFLKSMFGFQSGGYTGAGSPGEIAGIVHREEYVNDARTTNYYGKDFFAALSKIASGGNTYQMTNNFSGSERSAMRNEDDTALAIRIQDLIDRRLVRIGA